MTIVQAIILSIIEGITEFLPISSTGHMILASQLLAIPQTEFVKSFEIFIQLGAIAAVASLYTKTFLADQKLWQPLMMAFIPSGIIGFVAYKAVKTYLLGNTSIVIVTLLVGGLAMLFLEWWFSKRQQQGRIQNLSNVNAATVGSIQAISVIPGVSRSMATIFGGMGVGLTREHATMFSFLLAVPTMLAASGLDLAKSGFNFSPNEFGLLGIGFIGAFLSALVAVRAFIGYIQKHTFTVFAYYRIVLAIIFWLIYH